MVGVRARGGATPRRTAGRDSPAPQSSRTRTSTRTGPGHAVVLIDEIDKADPDLPNGLLVPLGSNEFVVTETRARVGTAAAGLPIVVITTNEERALPPAFLRRCVVLWLQHPEEDQLLDIATAHMREYEGGVTPADTELARALVGELLSVRADAGRQGLRPPSTAEFLDALRACRSLGIAVGSPDWARLRDLVLIKPQQPR